MPSYAISADQNKSKSQIEVLIVPVFEEDKTLKASQLDGAGELKKNLNTLLKNNVISGKYGASHLVHSFGDAAIGAVLVIGCGKSKKLTLDGLRHLAVSVARQLNKSRSKQALWACEGFSFSPESVVTSIVEGTQMGAYI